MSLSSIILAISDQIYTKYIKNRQIFDNKNTPVKIIIGKYWIYIWSGVKTLLLLKVLWCRVVHRSHAKNSDQTTSYKA
jgi:hypothetical protein